MENINIINNTTQEEQIMENNINTTEETMGNINNTRTQEETIIDYTYNESFKYNDNGNMIEHIENSVVKKFKYNKKNVCILCETYNDENKLTCIEKYNDLGYEIMCIEISDDGTEQKTYTEYDELNRSVKQTDPRGNVMSYEYYDNLEIEYYNGEVQNIHQYDESSNVILFKSFEHSYTLVHEYNQHGHLTREYTEGRSGGGDIDSTYEYDDQNKLICKKSKGGFIKKWEYDEHGNMIHYSENDEYHETFEYDELNRLRVRRDSDGMEDTIEYDERGNKIYFEEIGEYQIWEYDEYNSITLHSRFIDYKEVNKEEYIYEYDEHGNKTYSEYIENGKTLYREFTKYDNCGRRVSYKRINCK